jgi:hypothetical protein
MKFTTGGNGGVRSTVKRFFILTIAGGFLFSAFSGAQQTQPSPAPDAPPTTQSPTAPSATTPSTDTQSPSAPQTSNPVIKGGANFVQLLDRKSIVFPDLATQKARLSSWDKFRLAANESVSLATVGGELLGSAYNQATDYPSGYGQGGSGFGKRFGSGMARASSAFMFGDFLVASVFHEDPRFYVKKDLSFKQAVKYSMVRLVVTRSDSGEQVVNLAGLLGPLAGETLANAYWPDQNRSVSDTLVRYVCDQGWKFGGNLLRQYWPQINRKLRLVPQAEPATPAPSNP